MTEPNTIKYDTFDGEDDVKICLFGWQKSGKQGFCKQFTYDINTKYINGKTNYRDPWVTTKKIKLDFGKYGINYKILNLYLDKKKDPMPIDISLYKDYDIIYIIYDINTFNDELYNAIKTKIAGIKLMWQWDQTRINEKIICIISNKIDTKMNPNDRLLHFNNDECPGKHKLNDRHSGREYKIGCDICEYYLSDVSLKANSVDDNKDEDKNNNDGNDNERTGFIGDDGDGEISGVHNEDVIYNEKLKEYCDKEGIYYYEFSVLHERWLSIENSEYICKITQMTHDIIGKYYVALNPKTSNDNTGSCDNIGSIIYDTLTILISFADLVTDLIMLYTYYINGWKPFFILSLIVLILAQLSYCFLFTQLYGPWKKNTYICNKKGIII